VFTNGCFDVLHKGHIHLLSKTADLGDKVIVGINSDISIKKIKGNSRPIMDEYSRSILISSFFFIDAIILFSEETPINLINTLKPDILAKGGDYKIENIVGSNEVIENGGQVFLVPFLSGFSSTSIINKIKNI
jgi:rfaE bifunctional protein nucleotidyltransferase chain/domain